MDTNCNDRREDASYINILKAFEYQIHNPKEKMQKVNMQFKTIDDADAPGYRGPRGTARLWPYTAAATKANGDGSYTYKKTYSNKAITGAPIIGTPISTANGNVSNPYTGIYMKSTSYTYTEKVGSYLTAFNTAYDSLVGAGVTVNSIKNNESDYNTYVVPVTTAYNALNDYLKSNLDANDVSNYQAILASYVVGSKLDAFNNAYNAIAAVDATSWDALNTNLANIRACRAEYDALSGDIKPYVATASLSGLESLETAYSSMVKVKASGTFTDDFKNANFSNKIWHTNFLNKEYASGSSAIIFGNSTVSSYWLSRYFNVTTDMSEIANGAGDMTVAGGKATHTLAADKTATLTEYNSHRENVMSSIQNTVNTSYLPNDVKSISVTFGLNDISSSGSAYAACTSQQYYIAYGTN